jgi:hypothetical protein
MSDDDVKQVALWRCHGRSASPTGVTKLLRASYVSVTGTADTGGQLPE